MDGLEPDQYEIGTGRIEAFSDGVYAIAITLLVLELKVRPGLSAAGLRAALLDQWPSYHAFLVGFLTIGLMWVHHHRLFSLLRRSSDGLLVLNGLHLLTVTVVPFPTALVADYLGRDGGTLAVAVFTGWAVVMAAVSRLLWRYAISARRRPSLLRVAHDGPEVRAVEAKYRLGPLWYVFAFALSFVMPALAMAICGAAALWHLSPPRPPRRLAEPPRER